MACGAGPSQSLLLPWYQETRLEKNGQNFRPTYVQHPPPTFDQMLAVKSVCYTRDVTVCNKEKYGLLEIEPQISGL